MSSGTFIDRLSHRLVPWLIRRRRLVLSVAALITLVGTVG